MAKWFYYDGVRKIGPISSEDLKILADMAHIGVGTIIEAEDGRQTMARNIKGLFPEPGAVPIFEEVMREPLVAESPAPPIQTPQPPLPPRAPQNSAPNSGVFPPPGPGSATFGFAPEKPAAKPQEPKKHKNWRNIFTSSKARPELQTDILRFLAAYWNCAVVLFAAIGLLIAIGCFIGGIGTFLQILDISAKGAFTFLKIGLSIFVPSLFGFIFCVVILYLIGQAIRTWLKYDYYLSLKIKQEEERK